MSKKPRDIKEDAAVGAARTSGRALIIVAIIGAFSALLVAIINLLPALGQYTPDPATLTDTSPAIRTLPPSLTQVPTASPTVTKVPCKRWDFNDGNLNGWYPWKGIRLIPGKESLSGEITISDLGLLHMQLEIDTSALKVMRIRYRIQAEDTRAQIHWHTENTEEFLLANLIEFGIITDGEWHIAEIHLDDTAGWPDSKIVRTFRLDPVKDADSGTFEYDYITLCPD